MSFPIPFRSAADSDHEDEALTPHGNVGVKTRPAVKKPSMFKVFLLNDDYTPMDFVVQILQVYFNKSFEDATTTMLDVHKNGRGLCGVYTFEIAETKVAQVMMASRQAQHPLQCVMEKE